MRYDIKSRPLIISAAYLKVPNPFAKPTIEFMGKMY
ncbi:hypothetical protein IC1_05566 [Bacillus cereus VD022]|uniref:Uncharacterized protein n=1 Tax=Bacillus cereus TIAC219 TaxID=718222 RepID=A0ABC9SSQ0_BACCE|nr:hypothetical protein IC1_05566 [Bacillus cereus VD022]EOQ58879.1 hypothetical protein IAY_05629 [Bacillus cereus TIAC219]